MMQDPGGTPGRAWTRNTWRRKLYWFLLPGHLVHYPTRHLSTTRGGWTIIARTRCAHSTSILATITEQNRIYKGKLEKSLHPKSLQTSNRSMEALSQQSKEIKINSYLLLQDGAQRATCPPVVQLHLNQIYIYVLKQIFMSFVYSTKWLTTIEEVG